MGAVSPTANRIILLDFTHPYIHFPVTFIIPTPSFALNPAAILNPLDLWVIGRRNSFKLAIHDTQ